MDWEIGRPGRCCAGCEHVFQEEEDVYSGLYDEQTQFARRDYCPACWDKQDKPKVYSHWKTRLPKRDEQPKRFVDDDVLIGFFTRLEGEEEPLKVNFRYVLALLLIRKKMFKFKTVRRDGAKEWLVLYDRREDRDCDVLNPNLTEEQVTQVTEECGKLLNVRL